MNHKRTYYFGNRLAADYFASRAARVAGGATITDTIGWWRDDDGDMVKEPGASVVVYFDDDVQGLDIDAHAEAALVKYGEQSALVEYVAIPAGETVNYFHEASTK